jgi:hypothetical protein
VQGGPQSPSPIRCLISYGVDSADLRRKAATYVDRMRRAKPADLPADEVIE